MIGPFDQPSLAAARATFRWPRPERFNIAEAAVGHWARAEPERTAILHFSPDDQVQSWSYGRLERDACRLANVLTAFGLTRGGRIGVLLPQRPEAALTHLAAYKLGAVVLPLFTLFGEDALRHRIDDAGAEIVVTDAANLPKLLAARAALPHLSVILSVDGPDDGADGFWEQLEKARGSFDAVLTAAEDPAFLCYTSGTTGPAKGALHAHRALIGHLPGVQMWLQGLPRPGDVAWTPADWAWLGGLCNMLLPCLHYGVPLVAHRMAKFDPDRAFWIWRRFGVTVGFMPPTALKLMRAADGGDAGAGLSLRAIGCGGEPLGVELLDWGRAALGLTINEFYGQTECNLVAASNAALTPVKPGAIGPATPGFDLAILDGEGRVLPSGEIGEIAVRRDNASMFLGYWRRAEATAAKFRGDWMLTGDEGRLDEDGYLFFSARADDVITSAGYRVGPSEVEDCLMGHPAVAAAGVIGAPDPVKGEAVLAYVTLRPGAAGGPALAEALRERVKTRISPHVAPRMVRVVDALPMTATGKILRRALKQQHAEAAQQQQ